MNGTLGRDKVWNDHIWGEIDKAVRDEVGRIRVAQKVFPSTIVNNVLPIPANILRPGALNRAAVLRTGDDLFKPLIEMSIEFVLTQAQVDGEESMHLAPSLARLAASALAAAEDEILFLGHDSIVVPAPPADSPVINDTGVTVTNKTAFPDGFVKESEKDDDPPDNILASLARGIAKLSSKGQPGPYALFLSPKQYAKTFYPQASGMLATQADSINPLVTGGFNMFNKLSDNFGLLASLGGEPVKILLGIDATTGFTGADVKGDYHFRVFERIQLIVRDKRAFQRIRLPNP
jgi:uncharacterized linocin/CFP29 family protein